MQRVDVRQNGSKQTYLVAIAVVIHLAVFVHHDVAGSVADVGGIDGRHIVHLIEHAAVVAGHCVIFASCIVDVGAYFEPILGAIVGFDASRVAVVVAVVDYTFVVEIAE